MRVAAARYGIVMGAVVDYRRNFRDGSRMQQKADMRMLCPTRPQTVYLEVR